MEIGSQLEIVNIFGDKLKRIYILEKNLIIFCEIMDQILIKIQPIICRLDAYHLVPI